MAKKDGSRGRKIGRNKKWCEAYTRAGRREINKRRRLRRHLRRLPNDAVAMEAFRKVGGTDPYLTSRQGP